jgi:glycosyltransferase involved in cell wall biosynthesis
LSKAPLVSVIIPAHNAASWIGECVRSVIAQDWTRLEIIVVDDGSTDDTTGIVAALGDSRIRTVRQTRAGAGAARNRGLRDSTGDLIQFLDADDLLSPDKIVAQVRALETAPPRAVASCAWRSFSGNIGAAQPETQAVWTEPDPVTWLVRSLAGDGMMQTAGWLIPRDVTQSAGEWSESLTLHDDGEYFARILVNATRNVFVDGPTVYYRSLPESLSRKRSRAAIESSLNVCRLRHETLIRVRNDEPARIALATRYAQFAYEFASDASDLSADALASIEELGASPANTIGGASFRTLASLIGFPRALKVRTLFGSMSPWK